MLHYACKGTMHEILVHEIFSSLFLHVIVIR